MKSIILLLLLIIINSIFTALIKQPIQFRFPSKPTQDLNDNPKFKLKNINHTNSNIIIKSAQTYGWEYKYKNEKRKIISNLKNDKFTLYKYEEFSPDCIGAKFKCLNSVEYMEKKSVCPENYILAGYGNCIKINDCPSGTIPSPVIYPVPCIPILRSFENYSCAPGEIQIGGKACFHPKNCDSGKMPAPYRWKNKCIDMPVFIKSWTKKEIIKLTKIKQN